MSASSWRWRENRVREEIYKHALKNMNHSTNGTTLQHPSRVSALLKEATTKPPAKGKKSLARWLALSVVILGVIAGIWYWRYSSQFEETDDAYVTGHEHPVSFRVAGTISEVLVDDNQLFYQGKGVISKQDLDNAQYQSEGNKATYNAAVAAVNVAEANIQTAKAQEKAAAAQVEVASAQVQNAELQLSYTSAVLVWFCQKTKAKAGAVAH
jgi:membrane fusion protein, multidrug efflux system